jgi:glycine oxidase
MEYEVAVIGDGVIGAACAFHLADRGHRVVLVGKGSPGGTAAAGGMLSPAFESSHDASDGAMQDLMQEGLSRWEEFARRVSPDPGRAFSYRRDGIYGIGFHARPQGALVKPEPSALPAFSRQPAAFAPGEGAVEPHALVRTLTRRMAELSGRYIRGSGRIENGRVTVGAEEISAEQIVIATGAEKGLGPEGLQGVKGAAVHYRLHPEDDGSVPNIVRSPTVYFVPRADGTLYVGATEEWPGTFSATLADVERDALRLLPCLARAQRLDAIEGLRPFTSRTGPLIGRDGRYGHIVRAQGHYRNGILLAPLTAERVESILFGKPGAV